MKKCLGCNKNLEVDSKDCICKSCSFKNSIPYYSVGIGFILVSTVGLYAIG